MDSIFWYTLVSAALLGAIMGSFINALSFRYGTGVGMNGRSRCMYCGHELSARDLVPIFSFAFLGGRCRYCSCRISWQYPLVECIAFFLTAGIWLQTGTPLEFMLLAAPWLSLLFIVVYDVRHKIIPWGGLAVFSAAVVLHFFVHCTFSCQLFIPTWFDAAGALSAVPLLLLTAVSKGRWMGWGDGLLQLPLGLLLGASLAWSGLFISFWSGAIIGLILIAHANRSAKRHGGVTMKSEIPFAPFLALGAAVAYFFHADIFSILLP